ncbi:MAG: ABC transporter permease, partial [Armatimonadota bacterium]|nr:ABC transporter permease [Armatimonadota bacterium]
MGRLLRAEFAKVLLRPRSYLGYLGVLLLLVPYVFGFHYGRPEDFVRHRFGRGFEVVGTFFNALFLARLVMEPLFAFFLPLFVSFVAGDLVAGEAAEGTLRALLVRPVSRTAVVVAKFAVAMAHSVAMTLFLCLSALGLGTLFFG